MPSRTAHPFVAAHRRDRGDLRRDAEAGIGRPLSTLAVRRSVESRSPAELARRAGQRDRERRARAVAHAGRSRPERSGEGVASQQTRARRRVGARRQRVVLRGREARLRVGRRRAHPWRRKPHHGAAPGIQAVFPAEIRSARSTARRVLQPGRAAGAPHRGARRRAARWKNRLAFREPAGLRHRACRLVRLRRRRSPCGSF